MQKTQASFNTRVSEIEAMIFSPL